MAIAKKTTVKKTNAAKKTPAKRAAVTKKTSANKTVANTIPKMRSFRVSPNYPTFGTFKITRQTAYWVIIVSFIIFMQLWILALQIETSTYIENQLSTLNESM